MFRVDHDEQHNMSDYIYGVRFGAFKIIFYLLWTIGNNVVFFFKREEVDKTTIICWDY